MLNAQDLVGLWKYKHFRITPEGEVIDKSLEVTGTISKDDDKHLLFTYHDEDCRCLAKISIPIEKVSYTTLESCKDIFSIYTQHKGFVSQEIFERIPNV